MNKPFDKYGSVFHEEEEEEEGLRQFVEQQE